MRNYTFCGTILEQVQPVSYLGITTSKVLGMPKRNFWNFPLKLNKLCVQLYDLDWNMPT